MSTQDPPSANLRPLVDSDIPRIVELHRRGLSDGFLPALGPSFLHAMYEAILADSSAFGLATSATPIQGFILCTADRVAIDRALARRRFALLLRALPRLLSRPSLIPRLLGGLSYARRAHPCPAELIIIVVDDRARASGLGGALLTAARNEFSIRGVDRFSVAVTVENGGARRFYERYGMRLEGTHKVFGRSMAEYLGATVHDH